MAIMINRRSFLGAAGLAGLALLSGCSGGAGDSGASSASGQASGAAGASSSATDASAASAAASGATDGSAVVVGTLATEDILPLWVALDEGLCSETDIEVVPFQSATELISGVASGEVDLAMTDIMVTASMFASGIDVQMQWVTLGATPEQGRFGIMVGPDSTVSSLADLAGVPIGVGSNTILEYVMDKLMEGAGVAEDQIIVEELQKLPVRYQAMASGEVAAAALPGTLLALGEASGCKLVADDSKGENLSQSVMIARSDFLAGERGERGGSVEEVKHAWNAAVELINANPEAYRALLVKNANLSDEIADTYPISIYPAAALPTSAMVDPVLEWMGRKGYLTKQLAYDESTGAFSV